MVIAAGRAPVLGQQLVEDVVDGREIDVAVSSIDLAGAEIAMSTQIGRDQFAFYGTALTGAPQQRERWKRGVSLVDASLGEAVGELYVDRHFPGWTWNALMDVWRTAGIVVRTPGGIPDCDPRVRAVHFTDAEHVNVEWAA